MQIQFVLGPAGSGKTYRCLAEIAEALRASPQGAPLILLAPKQATFQLERQLLADPALPGFTRLQIVSFERLAYFIFKQAALPPPALLSDEGRLMVFQSLLQTGSSQLRVFHRSARAPGFAYELSNAWREFKRYQARPHQLSDAAKKLKGSGILRDKLHDLLFLFERYEQWLSENQLHDPDALLDLALECLRQTWPAGPGAAPPERSLRIGALWLDGFAQMTAQEIDLLIGLLPLCARATLAFNLHPNAPARPSWLSIWSVAAQTFRRLHEKASRLPGAQVSVDRLAGRTVSRFSGNPILAHLEKAWENPAAFQPNPSRRHAGPFTPDLFEREDCSPAAEDPGPVLELFSAPDLEAEAMEAARQVRRFVRAGGRYRETTVLVRDLADYHLPLRRAFTRFGIPFFLDRREPVSHHPLVQLTRCALRCAAFGWEHDDWFGALKTGLLPVSADAIDRLENEALSRAWKGPLWWDPAVQKQAALFPDIAKAILPSVLPAFQKFQGALAGAGEQPSGAVLVGAILELWRDLEIRERLEQWIDAGEGHHATVWDEMNRWLSNLELAFARKSLGWPDWIEIVETGLSRLTIGLIPPSLDQVVIGAIDRSRTPEVELAILLGFNEMVFPARPLAAAVFTPGEKAALQEASLVAGAGLYEQLGYERYYGYIACTRARRKLVVTWAAQDTKGNTLNPSVFVGHLQTIFPRLVPREIPAARPWWEAEAPAELLGTLLRNRLDAAGQNLRWRALERLPCFGELDWESLAGQRAEARLEADLVPLLYEPVLETSISRLEKFCACPFQFFVQSGLGAEERKRFEVDLREEGSFQHELLRRFHRDVLAAHRRWRDLEPGEARERIAAIAAEIAPHYKEGVFDLSPESRFRVQALTRSVGGYLATAVAWAAQNEFEPWEAELEFGLSSQSRLPPWEIDLGEGHRLAVRGKIDRVDLCRIPGSRDVLCLVFDYKARGSDLDPLLVKHGIRFQLPVYLAVLRESEALRAQLSSASIVPAGLFYINVQGMHKAAARRAAETFAPGAPQAAYQHRGWFNRDFRRQLDTRPDAIRGTQFRFRINKDGGFGANGDDLAPEEFAARLHGVEDRLRRTGREIFAGNIEVDPYQAGGKQPCAFCEYGSICRIDRWRHSFRRLA